jgi:hypothetical protein
MPKMLEKQRKEPLVRKKPSAKEKQALGDVGGWQASVEDAHLANINEHEITVRQTYVFSVLIFQAGCLMSCDVFGVRD